jgi:hypothetical protein
MKFYHLIFVTLIFSACSSSKKTTKEDYIRIISRTEWNAINPKPYKSHIPLRITIHHEGTTLLLTDDASNKIKRIQVWGMGPDRNWADIPYHFLVAPDGSVFEGRDVFTVGETATEYDPTGHVLISCLGNMNEQEMTEMQLSALIKLIGYCIKKYNLSIETLASHKDFSSQTSCPGKNLYKYLENGFIKAEVKKLAK